MKPEQSLFAGISTLPILAAYAHRFVRSGQVIAAVLLFTLIASQPHFALASAGSPTNEPADSSIIIEGPVTGTPSSKYRFTAHLLPKQPSPAFTYIWTPQPISGQGTAEAIYLWADPDEYIVRASITLTDGTVVSAAHTFEILAAAAMPVNAATLQVAPETDVYVGTSVTATLRLKPTAASQFAIIWSPFPTRGQGKAEAIYSWRSSGEKIIEATLVNADGSTLTVAQTVTVSSRARSGDHILFVPLVTGNGATVASSGLDIIGGDKAAEGAWPWQAALMGNPANSATHFCGGSLVAPDWVLTAAHCVDWWSYGTLYTVIGRRRLSSSTGDVLPVKEIFIHPDYIEETAHADIALLQLDRLSSATPVSLKPPDFAVGDVATVIGWGLTKMSDETSSSDVLLQVDVPVVSDSQCRAAYGNDITSSMFCAGQSGADSCSGDSGGPLMLPSGQNVGWSQIGIVSWGVGCGLGGYPGVYTVVSEFSSWLEGLIGSLPEPDPEPDPFEPDDLASQATEIAVDGSVQTHTFHVEGDQDWVRFDVAASTAYTIETFGLAPGNRTTLIGYDEKGGEQASVNTELGSRLVWTAQESGSLLARVAADGGWSGPQLSYGLSVVEGQAPADPAPYEPNDLRDQAQPIEVDGSSQSHNLQTPGDVDWLRFQAEANEIYHIETENLSSDADTVLQIVTGSETPAIEDDDGGVGLASRIDWMSARGETVFLHVRHYDPAIGSAETRYDVQVSRLFANPEHDQYEPDNSAADVSAIQADGSVQAHTFSMAGDEDWVKIEAVAGVVYAIDTQALSGGVDTVLSLYDDMRNQLDSNDDGGEGLASRLVWTAEKQGPHFIRVRNNVGGDSGPDARYEIRVAQGSNIGHPFEPDDSPAQAKPIGVDRLPQRHDFHRSGDVDWIKFEVVSGLTYIVETFDLAANTDTVVRLFDSSGKELASDDDGGTRFASRIAWTATENGVLYLSLKNYASSVGDPHVQYSIQVKRK